ncbi:NAD kinase [Liquorilactobacillus capillatus]|uniref:NAD kinase n=1 Tax=Liquorilactobacillus capillatus DSM 19910 TaxID=1423731 RepID=A0A0R1MFF4_9LACO|nr:NAD kinase [Liquorilactobacillus capillatus]KRL03011.1 inorganic polyphosphate ATP-NAD kinase [Liquorilactobacillus capillatus DSM 19910]
MRIAIFANEGRKSMLVSRKLHQKFKDTHFILDNEKPDIIVTVGGDGTLLAAFHQYQNILDKVRFVSVHTGHLGFYTDWRDDEIDDLVISLQSDNGQSVSYPLLDVKVSYIDQLRPESFLALNEATLKRNSATLVTDVYIGGELFEKFRGDGLCLSTPTGSTAYNKSLGGAVIHPNLRVLQMTEIGSINNRVFRTLSSPMIIAPNDWVTLYPNRESDYILTVDQNSYHGRQIKQITFKTSKKSIHFAKYRHMQFWQRVQDAFIGAEYAN